MCRDGCDRCMIEDWLLSSAAAIMGELELDVDVIHDTGDEDSDEECDKWLVDSVL